MTVKVQWREVDFERIVTSTDRRWNDTGPGNPDGFAPYRFGGRVQKWDGYWRNQPEYAPAEPKRQPIWPWERS